MSKVTTILFRADHTQLSERTKTQIRLTDDTVYTRVGDAENDDDWFDVCVASQETAGDQHYTFVYFEHIDRERALEFCSILMSVFKLKVDTAVVSHLSDLDYIIFTGDSAKITNCLGVVNLQVLYLAMRARMEVLPDNPNLPYSRVDHNFSLAVANRLYHKYNLRDIKYHTHAHFTNYDDLRYAMLLDIEGCVIDVCADIRGISDADPVQLAFKSNYSLSEEDAEPFDPEHHTVRNAVAWTTDSRLWTDKMIYEDFMGDELNT